MYVKNIKDLIVLIVNIVSRDFRLAYFKPENNKPTFMFMNVELFCSFNH